MTPTVTKLCPRCDFKLPSHNKNRAHLCAECQRDLAYVKGRLSTKHRAWIKAGRPKINRTTRYAHVEEEPVTETYQPHTDFVKEVNKILNAGDEVRYVPVNPSPREIAVATISGQSDEYLMQCVHELKRRMESREKALRELGRALLFETGGDK